MTMFWLIAVGMIVLAMAFVLPPRFRRATKSTVNRDELNIELIKQQLAELEADLSDGKLDPSEYAAARKDLERELLYDVSEDQSKPVIISGKSGRWAAALVVIALPLAAILLYLQIGSSELMPRLLAKRAVDSEPVPTTGDKLPSIEEMVAKLAAKLESKPDDPQGWFMLARSYMMMNRYADAASAYQKLHTLVGDQPEVLVGYADALAMAHEGRLEGKPAEMIHRALELDPNQAQGLWLAGMAADQQADHLTAINYWRRLEPLLKDEPKSQQEVRQLIDRAQTRAGITDDKALVAATSDFPPPSTKPEVTTPDASPGKSITINVALDPAVRQLTTLQDSLFVFVQALEGPPMPLAAVRKQVKDLPLEITLNDSMAMMPTMRLSNFTEVRISARISKTGNAKPQSGDLYGELAPVPVDGRDPVQITISKQVP